MPPDGSEYPVGKMIADDPPSKLVAVPTKVPLYTGRAMGLAVGMMVLLPTTMCGAPTLGKMVVEGPPVIAPASADAGRDGVDCYGYSHQLQGEKGT